MSFKMLKIVISLVCIIVATNLSVSSTSEFSNVPKILDLIEKVNHPEGSNATIICAIASGDLNGLTYEWRKDDVVVNSKKARISTAAENYQSVLRLVDLKASDAGLYTCIAKNKFGSDKVSTRLTVKVQLKWTIEPNDTQVGVGKPLSMACEADGIPKATVEWRKLNEGDQPIASGVSAAELRFASATQRDAGYYECRAANGMDKSLVAKVKVTVLGK